VDQQERNWLDEADDPGGLGRPQVATDAPAEPDETVFDKEAREARARLRDPERMERAKAEGWAVPTDEAGTSDRSG